MMDAKSPIRNAKRSILERERERDRESVYLMVIYGRMEAREDEPLLIQSDRITKE